jgi:hypothetical protein
MARSAPLAFVLLAVLAVPLVAEGRLQLRSAETSTHCSKVYTQQDHERYARDVWNRDKVSKRAKKRLVALRTCQHSSAATKNARRLNRRLRQRWQTRKAATPHGSWAIPQYVVMCESGGNFKAVNTSNPNRPAGAYQIITSTWLAYGGGRFAPTADAATPREQHIIAGRIWNSGGAGQWACA